MKKSFQFMFGNNNNNNNNNNIIIIFIISLVLFKSSSSSIADAKQYCNSDSYLLDRTCFFDHTLSSSDPMINDPDIVASYDYEERVLKARAYMNVLSNSPAVISSHVSGGGLVPGYSRVKPSSSGESSLIFNEHIMSSYDERFAWMKPFEFYECDHHN